MGEGGEGPTNPDLTRVNQRLAELGGISQARPAEEQQSSPVENPLRAVTEKLGDIGEFGRDNIIGM